MLASELEADAVHAFGVARRDDHVGSLLARPPGRLEPDAGAAADHDERLAGELRFARRDAASAPTSETPYDDHLELTSTFPTGGCRQRRCCGLLRTLRVNVAVEPMRRTRGTPWSIPW